VKQLRRARRSILVAIGLAGGCAHAAERPPGPSVAAPESGIDVVYVTPPTGQRETDRASILAALERVEPGSIVQFAAGTYLVGEIIPIATPRLTLLGHPEGTTLRGCSEAELDEIENEADRESDLPALFAVLLRCGIMELTGGHVTVRDFTFENTRMGLLLGCCHAELAFRPSEGGYRIEHNTFRDSGNAIRALLSSPEPTVIRGNRFINVFHALSAGAKHLRMLDNDLSVPEPERVAGRGHPGFGIGIWPIPGDFAELAASGGQPCEHNLIAGNRIEGHETGIVLFGEPGLACRQNVIRDNTIIVRRVPFDPARWPADAVGITDPADSTIVGVPLTLHNPSGEGRIEDNLIEGNQIVGADGIGIEVLRASRNRIVNNTITGIRRRDPFPGNTLGGDPQRWAVANGSGVWVSPGSDENEIVGNVFEDVASDAVVLEGDRNRVETSSPGDAVHDVGSGNRLDARAPPGLDAASSRHTVPDAHGEANAVESAIRGYLDAYAAVDSDLLRAWTTDDFLLIENGYTAGFDRLVEGMHPAGALPYTHYVLQDLEIEVAGELAVYRLIVDWYRGEARADGGIGTGHLRRAGDGWKLARDHMTLLPGRRSVAAETLREYTGEYRGLDAAGGDRLLMTRPDGRPLFGGIRKLELIPELWEGFHLEFWGGLIDFERGDGEEVETLVYVPLLRMPAAFRQPLRYGRIQ
jgi:parallel beta-helix repeat protein